jgi:uncharacterized protein (TIGR02246 family)
MTTNAMESLTQEEAIRRLVDDANRLQTDREQFIALHTDDTVIVNIVGRRVIGRDAVDKAMATALNTELAQVITHSTVEQITFIRPDVALVACTKEVEDHNVDAAQRALPTRASLTYVVVDDGDGWRIALAQTTARAST